MWESFYCILIIFDVLRLDSVDAAVFILPEQPKPENYANEDGCYVPELDKVLAYKKPYSPQDGQSCIQYICNEDNTTSGYTCGAMFIPDNCSRDPGNKSLPYPQCCDGISCPKQLVLGDPDLEEIPEVKDQPADYFPPVGYPRPCPTCPFEPGYPDPGSIEKSASLSVNSEQEEPSDHVVIPPNAPRTPMCAYFTDSSSDTREIPPYCPPVVFEPVDAPADKPFEPEAKPANETVDEPVVGPVVEPVVDPVSELISEPAVEPVSEPEVELVIESEFEAADEPVNEPVAEPVVEPVSEPEFEPAPLPPVDPEPEVPSSDPIPLIVPPKRSPKLLCHPPLLYYPDSSYGSATSKFITRYPPPRGGPILLAEPQDESLNPPIYHQPVFSLPVESPGGES